MKISTNKIYWICFSILVLTTVLALILKKFNVETRIYNLVLFSGWSLMGLSGLPMMIRREVPKGSVYLGKTMAFIQGLLYFCGFFGLGVFFIIRLLSS
jgi:hypothetical protein